MSRLITLFLSVLLATASFAEVTNDAANTEVAAESTESPFKAETQEKNEKKKAKTVAKSTAVKHEPKGNRETRFFNLSAIPNAAVYDSKTRIEGVTLSIWGENEQQSFAIGIVNGMPGNSGGFAIGAVNYTGKYGGVLFGAANWSLDDFVGGALGALNYAGAGMSGVQIGLFNYAAKMKGLQIGVVNYASAAESGLQIGLVNVISSTTSWFSGFPKTVAPVMIITNWAF
jgi:hypothetical protein